MSSRTSIDETTTDDELRAIFVHQCLVSMSRADLIAVIETGKTADMKRTRKTIPQPLRKSVWYRWYGPFAFGPCPCCEEEISTFGHDCGHIIAAAAGGMTCLSNLRPLCGSCNKAMGEQNFYDYTSAYVGDRVVAREPPVFPTRECRDFTPLLKTRARARGAPHGAHDEFVHVERNVLVPRVGLWARMLSRLR